MISVRRLGTYRLINGTAVHIDTIIEGDDGAYFYHSNKCSVRWLKNGKVERNDYSQHHSYDICETLNQPPSFV